MNWVMVDWFLTVARREILLSYQTLLAFIAICDSSIRSLGSITFAMHIFRVAREFVLLQRMSLMCKIVLSNGEIGYD